MPAQTSPTARSRRTTTKSAKTPEEVRSRASEVVAPVIGPERRRALIAEVAYFRAQARNFVAGYEVEDWLAAESEVDTALTMGVMPSELIR
jgi:hypothetical protein